MEGNRNFFIRNKPLLVLDRRFAGTAELQAGETGQLLLTGKVEGERIEEGSDYQEILKKIVHIDKIELIVK